jgi:biofilm protein TabA
MIHDTLDQSSRYSSLNPLFQKAFEFIKNNDFSTMEPGKYFLDGDNLYVTLMDIEGKTPEIAKMEAHRNYIDIQLIIDSCESMGWASLKQCSQPADAYNPEKDLQFFKDAATSYINVIPGEFAIFFPSDVHAPGIGTGRIRKAVFKVRI